MTVDLDALAARVGLPDEAARAEVRARVGARGGRLGGLAVWLAGVQGSATPRPPRSATLLVVAGDRGDGSSGEPSHPPAADGATASAAERAQALADDGPVAAAADDLDVTVDVVAGTAGGPVGPAAVTTADEVATALAKGTALADRLADFGTDLLVVTHVGSGAAAAAAALGVLLADLDVTAAVDRSGGDAAWVRDVPAVRDATRRARPVVGDRVALLAEVGGPDLATLTGMLLGAAARRTPVVVDGAPALACALLAHRIAYRAAHWWLAADTGVAPVAAAALDRLGLEPVADLRLPGPPGLAGLLAVPLLRAAAAL